MTTAVGSGVPPLRCSLCERERTREQLILRRVSDPVRRVAVDKWYCRDGPDCLRSIQRGTR